jgi:hypothetical protein
MSATATIPITIQPEAAVHVQALGLQRALEQMLDHTLQTVPGVHDLKVSLEFDRDGIDDPRIMLLAIKEAPNDPAVDDTEWKWGTWLTTHFPPEVFRHFVLLTAYGA